MSQGISITALGMEDYRFFVPPQPTEAVYENELEGGDPEAEREFLRNYVVEWNPEVFEPFVEVRSRIALSGEYPRWAWASALTYRMIVQQPVRHEISERFGHDTVKLVEHYMDLQEQYRDQLVESAPEAERKDKVPAPNMASVAGPHPRATGRGSS